MTTTLLEDLSGMLEEHGDYNITGLCNDCGNKVLISVDIKDDGQLIISGGAAYKPDKQFGYEDTYVYKCDECFEKDSKIHQINEVYCRTVGYYRPVKQFNPGKVAEFTARKNFDMPVWA